jgi:DNA replication and repair protein RecF
VWVRQVRLTDFRSYEQAVIGFDPGVTVLVGANGQGKTNVVEAIGYASLLSSHRVATDAPLVRLGAERAVVGVEAVIDERPTLVELEINPGRANRARLNRSPVPRPREIVGLVRTVLFAPEDLALVKGDPAERRRMLDDLLVQRSPRLHGVRADLDRVLKQRNALLRAWAAGDGSVRETLGVWDEQYLDAASALTAARADLVQRLTPLAAAAYRGIAADADLSMAYVPSAGEQAVLGRTLADGTVDWRGALADALVQRQREEQARGLTLVGPHRDDVRLMLGASPAKGFASHGESWSIALALRIAALDLMRAEGDDPVLILDDVFAELDATRRRALVEQVVGATQAIITAAVAADVPEGLADRRLHVSRGTVTPDDAGSEDPGPAGPTAPDPRDDVGDEVQDRGRGEAG